MIPVPPPRPTDGSVQTQATGWVFRPVACWAACRSFTVTSTRSTPSQLWQMRLKDSGRTIWRAIACRCPQHSHVTTARMTPPPGRPIRPARPPSFAPGPDRAAQSTAPRHRRCRFAIRSWSTPRSWTGRWSGSRTCETLPSEPADRDRDDDQNRAKSGDDTSHADQVGDDAGEQQRDRDRRVDHGEDAAEDPSAAIGVGPFLKNGEPWDEHRAQRAPEQHAPRDCERDHQPGEAVAAEARRERCP